MENTNKPTDIRLTKVKDEVSSVWKWISFPFKVILLPVRIGNWLRKHWRSAISIGVFAIGLAMMVGASFTLGGVQLVTVLLIGGILTGFAFVKMTYDQFKEGFRKAVERAKGSDTLKKEKIALADEVNRLRTELQIERSGGIKVSIRPILEIGFLQAECEVTKFFDRYFDENDKDIGQSALEQVGPGPEESRPVKRFLGGLTAKFRAKYGVNLQKVYVKRDDQARTLVVAGAEPSFLGTRGYPEMRWEGCIALKRNWLGDEWVTDSSISPKLELECREKYREAFRMSLANGPEQLNWVKEPLRRNIKRILKIIAQDYKVKIVDRPKEGFIPLSDYLRELGSEGPDQLLLP